MLTVKIVLGIAAAVLVLCVGAVIVAAGSIGAVGLVAARTIQVNPAVVNAAANQIADFALPAGYTPEASAQLAGYVFASYAPGDGHSHIQLVQGPANALLDQSTLEGYLQQAGSSRGNDKSSSRVTGTKEATIRGQAVTLVVAEAVNHDGEPYRTVTGVFRGKGGPALVSFESPISSWNQQSVDQFLASIR